MNEIKLTNVFRVKNEQGQKTIIKFTFKSKPCIFEIIEFLDKSTLIFIGYEYEYYAVYDNIKYCELTDTDFIQAFNKYFNYQLLM